MEFKLYDRKFKLIGEDLYSFFKRGGKNKIERWYPVKLALDERGYKRFGFILEGKRKNLRFHRVVYFAYNQDWNFYDTSKNNFIDHIDGKDYPINHPKNNHISNLRVVNQQENQFNTRSKGYSFHKASGKFQAEIKLNKKPIYLGLYDTKEEARAVYLEKKKELHKIRN